MPTKHANSRGPNASIPVRYRCKVGGEWKPIQAFSANQQRLIERQVSGKGKVDAANSGMTCLEHSAAFRSELRCDLCGLVKPYTDFSKSMRKTDDPMCKRCTAWTETQEPGVVPIPLETGHVTQEEEENMRNRKTANLPADFFPSDTLPQAPITSFAAMGIHEKLSVKSSSGKSSVFDTGSIPPHLVDTIMSCATSLRSSESDTAAGENNGFEQTSRKSMTDLLSETGASTSSVSGIPSKREVNGNQQVTSPVAPTTDDLPPHIRALVQDSQSGQVPFVGAFQGRATFRSNPSSISTATTVREGRDEVTFNAWDNSGQRHEAVKLPTERSDSSVTNDSAVNAADAWDDWTTVPVTKRKGGWHKAPKYRAGDDGTSNQPSTRLMDFGVDYQRRMNYCAPEDSSW
ncbi:hypothetical protein E4U43_000559 [Claviceps pusilla]|uniref:Stc1 domain-containing protein n=1 Tax=Claviceps pusilla TaxID=123648 RepID=A0A9P7NAH1_9HYPO|nr:hypothetical protein E4U43_000559 [Claviceps pusilla]